MSGDGQDVDTAPAAMAGRTERKQDENKARACCDENGATRNPTRHAKDGKTSKEVHDIAEHMAESSGLVLPGVASAPPLACKVAGPSAI